MSNCDYQEVFRREVVKTTVYYITIIWDGRACSMQSSLSKSWSCLKFQGRSMVFPCFHGFLNFSYFLLQGFYNAHVTRCLCEGLDSESFLDLSALHDLKSTTKGYLMRGFPQMAHLNFSALTMPAGHGVCVPAYFSGHAHRWMDRQTDKHISHL